MNALYDTNKIIGLAFAVGLAALLGFQAVKWRDEIGREAGRRLQKRIQQISDETAAEFQRNAPKWEHVGFSTNMLHGFSGASPGSAPAR